MPIEPLSNCPPGQVACCHHPQILQLRSISLRTSQELPPRCVERRSSAWGLHAPSAVRGVERSQYASLPSKALRCAEVQRVVKELQIEAGVPGRPRGAVRPSPCPDSHSSRTIKELVHSWKPSMGLRRRTPVTNSTGSSFVNESRLGRVPYSAVLFFCDDNWRAGQGLGFSLENTSIFVE